VAFVFEGRGEINRFPGAGGPAERIEPPWFSGDNCFVILASVLLGVKADAEVPMRLGL
jgi:hypothetical protein